MKPVRVFIVDDSATCRAALRRMLEGPLTLVVGEAASGQAALARIPDAAPDVVLMDVVMKGMDGLTATSELMQRHRIPIVVVSDLAGRGRPIHFDALERGALDVWGKPTARELADEAARGRFQRRVRLLAEIPVVTRRRLPEPAPVAPPRPTTPAPSGRRRLLCLGASTGGPSALRSVLSSLSDEGPPVLVAQHIAGGFVEGLARWLMAESGLRVVVVEGSVAPRPGVVYVPAGERDLVWEGSLVAARRGLRGARYQPSVDRLFESVAGGAWASQSVGVVLSGMGDDGARGAKTLRQAGAWTIAQDPASAVVDGMPGAAVKAGGIAEVLPIDEIGPRLRALGALPLSG